MDPDASSVGFDGRFLRVDVESWGGATWEVVRRQGAAGRGAVGIVALTPSDRVILVRVFRPPIVTALLEIPAGLLDRDDEDAAACAARELLEETGYRASSLDALGGWYSSAGMTDEYVQAFVAQTTEHPERGTDGEVDEVAALPFDEAVAEVRAGRIRDAKTALALLLVAGRRAGPDGA